MEENSSPESSRPPRRSLLRCAAIFLAILLAVSALISAVPALRWRSAQMARTRCLTNQRRMATGLLLYALDHDGCLPPPEYPQPDGRWRTWIACLQPYIADQQITDCPVNPFQKATNPYHGYPADSSYALNLRFFGVFAPGPFPIDNVEIPAQTVLLTEAGLYREKGPFGPPSYPWAMTWYWDTAWWPNVYPSPHNRRMNVAVADGHSVSVKVAYYTPEGHDPLYGRLGGAVYNWNGGYPNGQTDGAPRE